MFSTQEQAEGVRRNGNPSELDIVSIVGMAYYLLSEGKPLHLRLQVSEEIYGQKRKKELVPQLSRYGTVLHNEDYSRGIIMNLPSIRKIEEVVRDYKTGKLEGVVGMELSSMDAVLCGGVGAGYN